MHLSQGEIRAYQDTVDCTGNELAAPERRRVAAHLTSCRRCQAQAQAIRARAYSAAERLSRLYDEVQSGAISTHQARQQLAARLELIDKEKNTMSKTIFSRIPRPAWTAITLVLILAVALAFPGVRAAAVSFLGLFRVEQIQVIQIDPERLPGGLDSSSNLERIFSNNVKVEEFGQSQKMNNVVEAGQMAGFMVRQLIALDLSPAFYFQPGGSMTFNVDLELVKAVLKDIEREDIELPDELDQAVVQVIVGDSVVTLYGNCRWEQPEATAAAQDPDELESWEAKECITFLQMPSPAVTAPPELNLAQIGEAYLQILGFSREEAASLSRNIDWTTTFVVPIPRYHGEYREVTVDGVKGVLLDQYGYTNLLWVKNGMIYVLTGPRQAAQMLEIANSLQ